MLTEMLQRIDGVTADIAIVQDRIDAQLGELAPAAARLDAIPGVGPVAAKMILAESGTDMGRFPTRRIDLSARFTDGTHDRRC